MCSEKTSEQWKPVASLETLRLRAKTFEKIREFFKQRQVMEVDTPVLSEATTPDPNIHSFETSYHPDGSQNRGRTCYLSTSPEFHMKRLLCAGSGSIYQLSHVFRQSEYGKRHNPEFMLLEWYRVDMHYRELMGEIAELVNLILGNTLSVEIVSYQHIFQKHLNIDPLTIAGHELQRLAENSGLVNLTGEVSERELYLDYLLSHYIQPKLGLQKLTFVEHYPASQSAYANLSKTNPEVAERFELFYEGVELANGYQEVTDAQEQLQRFDQQNQQRSANNNPVQWDRHLIDALTQGMPTTAGVALGIDRLIQILVNVKNIEDVLAFPFNRA